MADQQISTPLDLQQSPNCTAPLAVQATLAGSIVYPSDDRKADLARANDINKSNALGVVIRFAAAGAPAITRYAGPVELTTDEWDAVAGTSGGLVTNTRYYLSGAVAGRLSATPGALTVPIGVATSPTTLLVQLGLNATE